jgi:hypothetical protein
MRHSLRIFTTFSALALGVVTGCSGHAEDAADDDTGVAPPPEGEVGRTDQALSSNTQAFSKSVGAVMAIASPIMTPVIKAYPIVPQPEPAQGTPVPAGSPVPAGGPVPIHPERAGDLPFPATPTPTPLSKAPESIVTDPSCITSAWGPASLTVTFTGCHLAMSGAPLDGSIVLGGSLAPLGLSLELQNLVIDDDALLGKLALTFEQAPGQPATSRFEASFRMSIDKGSTIAKIKALEITANEDGTLASGALSVASATQVASATFAAVRWATGQCHPVAGSLSFTDAASAATVTFLPTTSADGYVLLRYGTLPQVKTKLLEPCH